MHHSLNKLNSSCVIVVRNSLKSKLQHALLMSLKLLAYSCIFKLVGNLEIKAGWDNYKQGVLRLSQENVAERKNAYKALTLLGWIPLTLDYSNYLLSEMKKIMSIMYTWIQHRCFIYTLYSIHTNHRICVLITTYRYSLCKLKLYSLWL